jgi:hypothetical protein
MKLIEMDHQDRTDRDRLHRRQLSNLPHRFTLEFFFLFFYATNPNKNFNTTTHRLTLGFFVFYATNPYKNFNTTIC